MLQEMHVQMPRSPGVEVQELMKTPGQQQEVMLLEAGWFPVCAAAPVSEKKKFD